MNITPEVFERNLEAIGVINWDAVHHEFSQGLHGQKIEFGLVVPGTPEFDQWVEITAGTIEEEAATKGLPEVLVAVDSGTNNLVEAVAARLGHGVIAVMTRKVESGLVVLTDEAQDIVEKLQPRQAKVLDDIGTTGRTTRTAVEDVQKHGVARVDVLYAWQRQRTLFELLAAGIRHRAIITTLMSTYTPEECLTDPDGFCKRFWDLVPYRNRQTGVPNW